MNLSSEDNTLQLFKYIPDVTSQLLIQANDSQELVQVPNICDDLLLNGLDSNPGWTLGGLPVILNTPLITADTPSTIFLNSLPTTVDEPSILGPENILQLNDSLINSTDFTENDNDSEILLKASSRIITEDGLFSSETPLDTLISTRNIQEQNLNTNTAADSSNVTTEEFIDINGMLLQENTIINISNNEMLLNIQNVELQPSNLKVSNVKKKTSKKRKLNNFNKITKAKKNKINNVINEIITENNTLNLNINALDCPQILPNGLIEICNEDNTTTLVDVQSILNNGLLLTTEPNIESSPTIQNINDEPDSTVKIENEMINIDDLATVITAYRCKKCTFYCNDQTEFLEHFKNQHRKSEGETTTNGEIISVPNEVILEPNIFSETNKIIDSGTEFITTNFSHEPETTMHIVYKTEQIPIYNIETDDIYSKKLMRVKRKKKKPEFKPAKRQRKQKPIILRSPENDKIYGAANEQKERVQIVNVESEESESEEIKIYLCSECASQFNTVESCRNHMIQVHNLQSVDETDNSTLETTNEEVDPLEIVEPTEEMKRRNQNAIDKFLTTDIIKSRKNKCTMKGCQYRFAKPELLGRHEKCHIKDVRNQFKCPECEDLFSTWRLCSLHLWNCHQLDLDMYSCPLCDYKGTTPIKLTNHLKIHSDDREYMCPDCGRSFKQASQMRNHRVIHLDKELHDIPKWYAQKHCDQCGKDFADAKCLKKHIQAVHSKLKPFICNVCGHSCARKAMLQMHLRQHTGEKPYACKLCYYKTGDHNSLRRHMMRHSGERPYKCPHCSYQAIQSNSYKNHLASKHPGKAGAYNCTSCGFKSVKEESYMGHINDHKIGLIDANGKRKDADNANNASINIIYDNDSSSNSNNNEICDLQNTQTVTQGQKSQHAETEDDESQHFLTLGDLNDEQTVDTGGITIPADP